MTSTIPIESRYQKNLKPKIFTKKEALECVSVYGGDLYGCTDELRNNAEVVLAACKETSSSIQYASDELKSNKEFILKILKIKKEVSILREINSHLLKDKSFMLEALERISDTFDSSLALDLTSNALKNDFDIVYKAVTIDGNALSSASEKMKDNDEIVYAALKNDAFSFNYISKRHQEDLKTLEYIYKNDIPKFFQIKDSIFVREREILVKKFNDFVNTKRDSEFYINSFKKLNEEYVTKTNRKVVTVTFEYDYQKPFEFLISKIRALDFYKIETKIPEVQKMMVRKQILFVDMNARQVEKRKSRKIVF